MVAYSFHPCFERDVAGLIKLQTCRSHRRRHARPGEAVQLYTGMRTRHCRKLVDPDPICTMLHELRFDIPAGRLEQEMSIEIDGIALDQTKARAFAIADGFGAITTVDDERCPVGPVAMSVVVGRVVTELQLMTAWWIDTHGPGIWQGVCIRWLPADVEATP